MSRGGTLCLTLVAPGLAREVEPGDYIYGGLCVVSSDAAIVDTEIAARVFRAACENGLLADSRKGQRLLLPRRFEPGARDPYVDWPEALGRVVETSFSGGSIDEETRAIRRTVRDILTSPFELLLHLVARGLLGEDERDRVQASFDQAGDPSLYGLVNAITATAHHARAAADWRRALGFERRGGEVQRDEHTPPVDVPIFA